MIYQQLALFLLTITSSTLAQPKCDQTPKNAYEPSENNDFVMTLTTKGSESDTMTYGPDQTYVLVLKSTNPTRAFRWFMITAEDPSVDNADFQGELADVGTLKSLDGRQSRYSERCMNTVENTDHTEKSLVEVHWVSPKARANTKMIRIRATVGESEESWYTGSNLTIILHKNEEKAKDSPPIGPREECNLCSEAQYEVIFNGRWSRLTHPQHYPSKPDENGYSHMIGASHAPKYTLWELGVAPSDGIKQMAESGNITTLEREIIDKMALEEGTRTLIRGKRRHHPHMSEPSHSFLRVDRFHHLFSLVVGLRPSPDWFLGVSNFELCTEDGWLEKHTMPLYPWDAGTMDGISYESLPSRTQGEKKIERVALGSFDRASPFFQLNLNDLHPFAILEVTRLDIFPLNIQCNIKEAKQTPEEPKMEELVIHPFESDRELTEPRDVIECTNEWANWSPCVPYEGNCGPGVTSRSRYEDNKNVYYESVVNDRDCQRDEERKITQTEQCYIDCL